MIFSPEFHGEVAIRTPPGRFLERFARRVEGGFLFGRPHRRWRYGVTRLTGEELSFRALGLLSSINVGLNVGRLCAAGGNRIEYRVTYWTWAAFAVALCGVLGLVLMVLFFAGVLDADLGRQHFSADPERNRAIGAGIFWACVLFWGFVWPWVLIALHKGPVRRWFQRFIEEVDGEAEERASATTTVR